jgi:surfactin synthase thioesterase subunit
MFCLPYAGGGTAVYHRWRAKMPAAIEVMPLSLPGHDGRLSEPLHTDLRKLVDTLVDDLTGKAALDRRFVLLGHSMGAWIAVEMARALRRENLPLPRLLILAGARPPHAAAHGESLHRKSDEELVAAIDKRYGGIPAVIRNHPEALRLLLPVLRADMEMVETYQPTEEPPLEVDMLVLGGADDPAVSVAHLNEWRQYTTRDCSVRLLPGGHFFLFQGSGQAADIQQPSTESPALQAIVARLSRLIATGQTD